MMISLYYIKHHFSRIFLSHLGELLIPYCLSQFVFDPTKILYYIGFHALIPNLRLLIRCPLTGLYNCLNIFLRFISPLFLYFISFHFLKEILQLSPLREASIRIFHFISFPTILPFHHDVHCMMPDGIARLLPLCTPSRLPK